MISIFALALFVSLALSQSISVTLTTGDQSHLLSTMPGLSFRTGNGPSSLKVKVDANQTFQTTVGFGGAMTDSSAWLISRLSASTHATLMNDLFGNDGLRMSFIRIPMGSSDFALYEYTYDDLQDKNAQDPQLTNFTIKHDLPYIIPVLRENSVDKSKSHFSCVSLESSSVDENRKFNRRRIPD